jgi:hypothetical protein
MEKSQQGEATQAAAPDKTKPDPKVVAPKLVFLTEAYIPRNQDGHQSTAEKPETPESKNN